MNEDEKKGNGNEEWRKLKFLEFKKKKIIEMKMTELKNYLKVFALQREFREVKLFIDQMITWKKKR